MGKKSKNVTMSIAQKRFSSRNCPGTLDETWTMQMKFFDTLVLEMAHLKMSYTHATHLDCSSKYSFIPTSFFDHHIFAFFGLGAAPIRKLLDLSVTSHM